MNKIDYFLDVEKKYNLYDKTVEGVNFWNYGRFKLWNYNICASGLNLTKSHTAEFKSFFDAIKKAFGLLGRLGSNLSVPKEKTKILFVSHERRVKSGSVYECAYTSSIAGCFDKESVTLEAPYEGSHFSPIPEKKRMYLDFIVLGGKIHSFLQKKVLKKHYKKIRSEVSNEIKDAVKDLQDYYGWGADLNSVSGFFADYIILYEYEFKRIKKLVKKINPELVIESVGYGRSRMMINEIGKELGIKTIELQHGTIYENHAAYQFNTENEIKQVPDYVFTFSDFWKRRMNAPVPDDNIISVGYPFFERSVKKYSSNEKDNSKVTILFISQGTIGKQLSEVALQLRKLLPDNYRMIYKLHPDEYIMWETTYKDLISLGGIEIIHSSEKSLYEMFSISDVQIGVYSTAIYEGLGFNLKTLICKIGHYEEMKCLVDEGYAQFVGSAEEAQSIIENFGNNTGSGSSLEENPFYVTDSLNNCIKSINEILKENSKIS